MTCYQQRGRLVAVSHTQHYQTLKPGELSGERPFPVQLVYKTPQTKSHCASYITCDRVKLQLWICAINKFVRATYLRDQKYIGGEIENYGSRTQNI